MKFTEVIPPITPRTLHEKLPQLAELCGVIVDADQPPWPIRVLGTRSMAQEVIEVVGRTPGTLDFEGIEVASTPFLDELRKAWPDAQPLNMNEDVALAWEILSERHDYGPADE